MSKDEKGFINPVGLWSYEGKISIEFFPGNDPRHHWKYTPFPTRKPVAVFEKGSVSQDQNWVHVSTSEPPTLYPDFTVSVKKILGDGKLLWVNPHMQAFFAGYTANVDAQNPYDEASMNYLMWARGQKTKSTHHYPPR